MDVMEAIRGRRSVRKYLSETVPEEAIQKFLEAAMTAPSAGNQQPWQFVVVTDPEKFAAVKGVHPYVGMADKAPLGILVCGDPSLEKFPGFWVQDCSAAMQNLLLAVHGLGYGGVWTGIYPMEERVERFREIFNLPEHVVPMGYVVIGRPEGETRMDNRFNADRVHRNGWNG